MSNKNSNTCIQKALDDESLFVLMARDVTAPLVILEWIKLNLGKQPEEKLMEAFNLAMEMHRTCQSIQLRSKMADVEKNAG